MISICRVVANLGKGRRLYSAVPPVPLLDVELTDIEVATVETLEELMDAVREEASCSFAGDVGEWGGVDDLELGDALDVTQESLPDDEGELLEGESSV